MNFVGNRSLQGLKATDSFREKKGPASAHSRGIITKIAKVRDFLKIKPKIFMIPTWVIGLILQRKLTSQTIRIDGTLSQNLSFSV